MWRRACAGFLTLVVLGAACTSDGDTPPPAGDQESDGQTAPVPTMPAELPEPRTEVAGTTWIDRIAVVGGLGADGGASARADVWDPSADAWDPLPDLPLGLHHSAVVSLDDRLWVVGGYTVDGSEVFSPVDTVLSLGVGDDAWREEPPLPAARGALAAAVVDERIVVAGGVDRTGEVLATTLVFDAGDATWEAGPQMAAPREHLALTTAGDDVYAIAGRIGGIGENHGTVEVLRGATGEWERAPSVQRSRGGIGAASIEGVPCVAGGEEPSGTIAPVECLVDGSWEVVAELAIPRHGLVVAAFAGRLHVIGGGPDPGLTVSGAHEVFEVPAPGG